MSCSKQNDVLLHQVTHLMSKLSDRDTALPASSSLSSLIPTLSPSSLPSFISPLSSITSSDPPSLRRHSLLLLSLLSSSLPPSSLSPHLPRLLSAPLRFLRDPDSSVRSAVLQSLNSLSSALPRPSLLPTLIHPLLHHLFHDQHLHSQSLSALSISTSIQNLTFQHNDQLSHFILRLVPRLVKLCRAPSFKAKPSLLELLGNVAVFAAGFIGDAVLKEDLLNCLLEFLRSEDWATRKAAAETLTRLAGAERSRLSGCKDSCLAAFEARRYDKVKIVRDSMNRMVEEWKKIPDEKIDDLNLQLKSSSYVKEMISDDGSCPTTTTTTTKSSSSVKSTYCSSKPRRKTSVRKSPPPAVLISKKMESNSKMAVQKKYSDRRTEVVVADTPPYTDKSYDKPIVMEKDAKTSQNNGRGRFEVKRALFEKNWENKENSGLKSGTKVLPFHEIAISEEAIESGVARDREEPKDDDLSLIRMQLVQIENQQSSLLNLLQRFMGSSQNGMHSLEARVRGLENVLDDMSRNIAASRGRGLNDDWGAKLCCRLPVSEILSSKFWRKTESSNLSRLLFYKENQRFAPRVGFINPLAEANPRLAGTKIV